MAYYEVVTPTTKFTVLLLDLLEAYTVMQAVEWVTQQ